MIDDKEFERIKERNKDIVEEAERESKESEERMRAIQKKAEADLRRNLGI